MKIPVFHDDQHGTAIVVGAALLNALKVVGKDIGEVKLVTSGAGAAALACLGLLVKLGLQRENIWVTDLAGVVYEGRTELMDAGQGAVRAADRAAHAGRGDAPAPTSSWACRPAACSSPRWWPAMARAADDLRAGQPDAGDPARAGARRCATTPSSPPAAPTTRTRSTTSCASRTSSAARWTAARPRSPTRWRSPRCMPSPSWRRPSRARWWPRPMPAPTLSFGPEYLIPKPFDPRLMMKIAPAVAQAAAGVGRGARGRSPTWTPTARSCRASSTPRARR